MSSDDGHREKWVDDGVAVSCPMDPLTYDLFFDRQECDGKTVKACPRCGTGVTVLLEVEIREGGA